MTFATLANLCETRDVSTDAAGAIPVLNLPQRLRVSMEWAGMAIPDMAKAMRVSERSIRNYIKGDLDYAALMLWARVTGVDGTWLETGQAGPTNGPGLTLVAGTGFEPVTSGFQVGLGLAA